MEIDPRVAIGGLLSFLALIFLWRDHQHGRKADVLPPPSKDVERNRDAGWWS